MVIINSACHACHVILLQTELFINSIACLIFHVAIRRRAITGCIQQHADGSRSRGSTSNSSPTAVIAPRRNPSSFRDRRATSTPLTSTSKRPSKHPTGSTTVSTTVRQGPLSKTIPITISQPNTDQPLQLQHGVSTRSSPTASSHRRSSRGSSSRKRRQQRRHCTSRRLGSSFAADLRPTATSPTNDSSLRRS